MPRALMRPWAFRRRLNLSSMSSTEPNQSALATAAKEYKFPCKNCGADLIFAPGQNELKCPFCGHLEKIPDSAESIKEYSFNDYLAKPRNRGYGENTGRDIRCNSCGA